MIAKYAPALMFLVLMTGRPIAAQDEVNLEWLKQDVGAWNIEMKYWPNGPQGEPIVFEAVETNALLGDNWIISDVTAEFGDTSFRSHGVYGFDVKKRKVVGTWVDSANGFMSRYEGKRDEKTNTIEWVGQEIDPTTGELVEGKQIRTVQDADTRTITSFQKPEGSDEFVKVVEMTLRRQKD